MEAQVVRCYPMPYILDSNSTIFRTNPMLEKIIPSLMFVKALSILDDAFNFLLKRKEFAPTKHLASLKAKIDYFDKIDLLHDSKLLHKFRIKRNEIAHGSNHSATWEEMWDCLNGIEIELRNLKFWKERPKFEIFCQSPAMRKSSNPKMIGERDYEFGLTENNKRVFEVKWTEQVSRDSLVLPETVIDLLEKSIKNEP